MNITKEFKLKVIAALAELRANYGGSDKEFSRQQDLNYSVYSRIKNGETENIIKDSQWLNLGRELNIGTVEKQWKLAKTAVYEFIKSDVEFCKENSKAIIFVDECAIGKTVTGKHLSKTLKNCFYVDCSQGKTKHLFIRLFAKSLGVESIGKYSNVKENIKYYLKNHAEKPVVILDEAGDLEYTAFLELKELWNATDGLCGWYMMGADGLRNKIEKGIGSKKVGFREMFSRFSDKFMSIVPVDRDSRLQFYKQLIGDVLTINMSNKADLPKLIKKCLTTDAEGQIGGLRRAETLLIINNSAA